MLSGKSGKVHVHMGDGETGLGPLWKIVKVRQAIWSNQVKFNHFQLIGNDDPDNHLRTYAYVS